MNITQSVKKSFPFSHKIHTYSHKNTMRAKMRERTSEIKA